MSHSKPSLVLPFPERYPESAADRHGPVSVPNGFVETKPIVGYNGVMLTYYDDDGIPRLECRLDLTVPHVEWWRRMLRTIGDSLPPTTAARPSPFRPRLLP